MATFSLDDLRAAVNRRYAPTVIENGDETFVLQNMLQLPADRRAEAERLSDIVVGEGVDPEEAIEAMRDIIRVVTDNDMGDKLLKLLGDNPASVITLGETWMQGTQLGEADGSSE